MLFMNEYDVDLAADRFRDHPVLGAATQTLGNLMDWANENSDGWAYWPKPCRAARQLQELIQGAENNLRNNRLSATEAEYRKALKPIKAFRTRQGADFEIEEVQ